MKGNSLLELRIITSVISNESVMDSCSQSSEGENNIIIWKPEPQICTYEK